MKLSNIVNDWDDNPMVAAAYAAGLSVGQELAEKKIRRRINTIVLGRYHHVQMDAVRHVLADNRHAMTAPICPEGPELLSWEF